MPIYCERHVKINDLKEWVQYLSIDDIKKCKYYG